MTAIRPEPGIARRLRGDGPGPSRQRQRGVALLVAILLVALGTIIAAAMAYDNAMTARRAVATFDFDQALLVAEGAEALAAYGLQQTQQSNPQFIAPGQGWDQPFGPAEVSPGVTLQASLEDLQGRFNINNLIQGDGETPNTTAIQAFQRLLEMLNMDKKWADYIVDWIDKDTTPMFPDGAEDSVYMEMNPPYRTPNLPITSTSQLMALTGFTRADFDKLAPYIAALPIGTTINLCSASADVLNALVGHQEFSAEQLDQSRQGGRCFPTVADFTAVAGNTPGGISGGISGGLSSGPTPNAQQNLGQMVSQKSIWFRLTSFVDLGSTEFAVYTLLYLDRTQMVRPVMRSFTPD